MRRFRTFIGVDLGGGKGKNTALARLALVTDETGATSVEVLDYGTGKDAPWYDARLLEYLRGYPDALVAIDAPLTLPSCVRCTLPVCPTTAVCEVPIVSWFRNREQGGPASGRKPKYTPYTQRATEVLLHEEHQILPRETLGQGMGPLTARGIYLTHALAGEFRLNENLIEVYPKASITQLFGPRLAGRYKRTASSAEARLTILNGLLDLRFAPGAWREDGLGNDHKFDAIMCAYTAYLWSEGRCVVPTSDEIFKDGWIWFPNRASGEPRPV